MTKFFTYFNNDIARLSISGDETDLNEYFVEFIDINTENVEYSASIKVNFWSQIENIRGKNISIKVYLNDSLVFERNQNYKFNRVYILFGSASLGDNIAWIPYAEEYRKLNKVEVLLYTPFKSLFDKVYPDIIFIDISSVEEVYDVDKKFRVDYGPELYVVNGQNSPDKWIIQNKKYDNFVKYFDYRKYSLQSIASLILGLPDIEIKSRVNIPDKVSKIKGKYVVIAIQSTSQLKYWNNPFGWDRLFDFLSRNGYKIVIIDKHKNYGIFGHFNQAPKNKNVIDKTGNNYSLEDRIIDIKGADMMITISSGLAWLSWAVGTPVVLISGFTKPWYEFKSNVIRIHNSSVCNGCWNDPKVTFDLFNWMFCPKKLNFVCSMSIQPKDVIDGVKKLIKK